MILLNRCGSVGSNISIVRVPVTRLRRGGAELVLVGAGLGFSEVLAAPRVEGRAGLAVPVCLEGRELSPPRRDGFFMENNVEGN